MRRTTHHNPMMLGTHIPTNRPEFRSTRNHRHTLTTRLANDATAKGVSMPLNDGNWSFRGETLSFSMVYSLFFDSGDDFEKHLKFVLKSGCAPMSDETDALTLPSVHKLSNICIIKLV